MSVAFSSDDSEAINRRIENPLSEKRDESISLEDMYEIGRCIEWINSNNFSKVGNFLNIVSLYTRFFKVYLVNKAL